MPRGCALNEAAISPWKNHDMLCANPQPGQKVMPDAFNGQSDAWASVGGISIMAVSAAVQKIISKYLYHVEIIMLFIVSPFMLILTPEIYKGYTADQNN